MSGCSSYPSDDYQQLLIFDDIKDIRELRDLYRRDWPTNCMGYYTLQNFINWFSKEPYERPEDFRLYTLDADWRNDGLFLMVDHHELFMNSIAPGNDQVRLDEALKLLDWHEGYKFTAIPQKHLFTAVTMLRIYNIYPRYDMMINYRMYQSQAAMLDVNCPPEYKLRPLKIADASTINSIWPNRYQGSIHFLKRIITHNLTMGLYKQSNNELIAWCMRCQVGCLSTLQVKSAYARQGLGSVVVKAFARAVSEVGDDVHALVHEHNEPAAAFFLKLGFVVTGNAFHVRAFRSRKFSAWLMPNEEE